MLLLFLLLWSIAAMLIITNPKSETSRWGSAIAFFSGFGGLAGVLNEMVSPTLQHMLGDDSSLARISQGTVGLFASMSHYLSPYTLLIFSFRFTGVWAENVWMKRFATLFFLVPVPIMYVMFPAYPQLHTNYTLLTSWVAPYVLTANFLLIRSAIREKHPLVKRQRGLACLVICPLTLFSLMTNYVMRMVHIEEAWRYNTWIIALEFVVFLYFAAKYGLLGIKVRFEKQSLDSTMRAMSTGTAFLNHTIKNQITKISMSADTMRASPVINNSQARESVDVIASAAEHMIAMVNRIHGSMQDLILNVEIVPITSLIDQALTLSQPYLNTKRIHVYRIYPKQIYLTCDPVHVMEVFNNLIKNAIDAMQTGGKLSISFSVVKRQLAVYVKDDGIGIPKKYLTNVFEPFFTTKANQRDNFGLGLSYCYNVMRKHGGSLDIQSKEGEGTSVGLRFPLSVMKP